MKKLWFKSGVCALILMMAMAFTSCENDVVRRVVFEGIDTVHNADVVVVGGGGAGLTAALYALEAGLSVILLEQNAFTGGNTLVNGGGINAVRVDDNFMTIWPRRQDGGIEMSGTEVAEVLRMIDLDAWHSDYDWLGLTPAQRDAANAAMAPWQTALEQHWAAFSSVTTPTVGGGRSGGWFDSPALFSLQMFESGDFINDPELVEIMTSRSGEAWQWLYDRGATVHHQGGSPGPNIIVGSLWHRNYMLHFHQPGTGGPSWPAEGLPTEPTGVPIPNPDGLVGGAGAGYVRPQEVAFMQQGGIRLLNHRARELITNSDGHVTGVVGTNNSGTFLINASAVVLASGGFGGNPDMLARFNPMRQALFMPGLAHDSRTGPRFTTQWINIRSYGTTNMISAASGEAILMAERVGANLVHMGEIQLLPGGGNSTNNMSIDERGYRQMNEQGRRDVIALQWTDANLQRNGRSFSIIGTGGGARPHSTDEALVARLLANFYHNIPLAGATNTLSEANQALVAAFVPGNPRFDDFLCNFQWAVGNYNDSNTLDYYGNPRSPSLDPYGNPILDDAGKLVKGPSLRAPWGATVNGPPNIHHTMGGVQINARAEVLNAAGEVIPGLFAAGEVTGGVHGSNRIGGNAVTDIVVFGLIAGETIAEIFGR